MSCVYGWPGLHITRVPDREGAQLVQEQPANLLLAIVVTTTRSSCASGLRRAGHNTAQGMVALTSTRASSASLVLARHTPLR